MAETPQPAAPQQASASPSASLAVTPPPAAPQPGAPQPTAPPPAVPLRPRRARRPRFWGTPPGDDGVVDVWLMSYADMVTLLMTAFVILVLLAGPAGTRGDNGPDKVDGIRGFLNNIFELRAMSPYGDESDYLVVGREGGVGALTPEQRAGLAVVKRQDLDQIQRRLAVFDQVRVEIAKAKLADYIRAEASGDGIRMDLPNPIIFGPGATEIDSTSLLLLRALVPILSVGDFQIVVEGHTDDAPAADAARYPSNWELSAARAATVARFLIGAGIDPKRLTVAGRADTQPLLPNDTEEHRAQNRRITFLLKY